MRGVRQRPLRTGSILGSGGSASFSMILTSNGGSRESVVVHRLGRPGLAALGAEPPVVKSAAPAPELDALFERADGWIGADGATPSPCRPRERSGCSATPGSARSGTAGGRTRPSSTTRLACRKEPAARDLHHRPGTGRQAGGPDRPGRRPRLVLAPGRRGRPWPAVAVPQPSGENRRQKRVRLPLHRPLARHRGQRRPAAGVMARRTSENAERGVLRGSHAGLGSRGAARRRRPVCLRHRRTAREGLPGSADGGRPRAGGFGRRLCRLAVLSRRGLGRGLS